jgi:hypothetical protein
MATRVSEAFHSGDPEILEDGSRWTASFADWDPYRHMTLTMSVTLRHADGREEVFEHGMPVPAGVGEADRESVRADVAFACRYRAGIFAKARAEREAAERAAAERVAAQSVAAEPRRWSFEVLARGLPNPDGTVVHPSRTYRFPWAAAEGLGWSMAVPSYREDSTFWAPEDWDQLHWVGQQSDLTGELRAENDASFTDAEAFEFVERLGTCVVGPSLEERFVLAGGDVIAPPREVAASAIESARAMLTNGQLAKAFDLATRMLVSREQRVHARRVRAEIFWRFGCVEDARIEGDRVRLLGGPANEPEWGSVPPGAVPSLEGACAFAIELQGLPLEGGGVEGHLVRYLFRVEVTPGEPGATVAPLARWLGVQGEVTAQLGEQAEWLSRVTGVAASSQCQWALPDVRALMKLVYAAERCLRGKTARELQHMVEKSLAPA